jgi:hypothetical protein
MLRQSRWEETPKDGADLLIAMIRGEVNPRGTARPADL